MERLGRLSQNELDVVDVTSLDDLSIGEEVELSPLQFDTGEYTPLEQFVYNLALLPDKPNKVSVKTLCVNGKVIRDKMENYLQHSGESSSGLKEILKTPLHYLLDKNQDIPERDESHFETGTFFHSAVLEPAKFNKVIVEPKANRNTTSGCKELVLFYWQVLDMHGMDITEFSRDGLKSLGLELKAQAQERGYTFIQEEGVKIIKCMRVAYNTYGGGILPKIFKCVTPEVSMYTKDRSTGLKVKIRPDAIMLEENFGINGIISLKTTNAPTAESFLKDAAKYKYELSEGMYLDVASSVTGRKFTATVMVMLQTVIPFAVAVFYWDAEDLHVGKYKYHQALDTLKQCKDTNEWLGFDCKAERGNYGILEMKLPSYIKNELAPQGI